MKKIKLTVQLDEKQYSHLKEQANISGFKMEPFIRSLIMGTEIKPRPPDEIAKLYRELSAIGNNINQIAAKQHSHGFMDEPMLREAVASLQRMEREFTRAFAQES